MYALMRQPQETSSIARAHFESSGSQYANRDAAIDAMRITAEKRTEGILGNSRRQHYGHAALLVASCVAFAPKSRASELLKWATDLRQRYSRRHAFRQELARACESLDVFIPA